MRILGRINRALVSGWMLALVCLAGTLALFEMENEWFTMPFSICVLLVLASILFLFSKRIAFSLYAAWALMGTVTLVSLIKFREQGFDLHAYDIVFVGGDASLYAFLFQNYLHLALPVIAMAGLALLSLGAIAFHEPARRTPLAVRLLAPVALFGLLPVTIPATAAIDRHEYIVGGHHASAFFVSLLDIPSLFAPSELILRLADIPAQDPFADTVACSPAGRRPDVFMVLSETQTPPFNFPQLGLPENFADGFRSDDGKTRALRVETFGGGTWISNFSLMTGLSAADFGWQRPYLTIALEHKVRGGLPELLARCGYRTAAILPVDYAFVNEGPFLRSIGVETVLDKNDIGAGDDRIRVRDSFYYQAAERFIAGHRRDDGRPLFLMVQTLFPHGPHNERLEPQLTVAGEPFSADPEIDEYLRRLHIAREDFQAFLSARRADLTRSVVLEFGDHQASATMPFIEELEGSGALADPDSLAYVTHFTAHAFGHAFEKPLPEFARLDIAYLGATFAKAAGLPTSPLMQDLLRLRDLCAGRFHSCPHRDRMDRHLRRRVDSGFLDIMDHRSPGS